MTFSEACTVYRAKDESRFEEACEHIAKIANTLTASEVASLAVSLAASGNKLDLPADLAPFADVPSTGAPASLSTLLAPLLVAAGGARVPKISATGSIAGGIDTLALVPNFRTILGEEEFIEVLKLARIVHVEQSIDFCPADKVLIKVRRRPTVDLMGNPNLAAASLLSKKLAVPNTAAVFDVRVGDTGNMGDDFESARQNVLIFREAAKLLNLHIGLVLTDNRFFPSSALGRVESLELLWEMLTKPDNLKLKLDQDHLSTNILLAAEALKLAFPESQLEFDVLLRDALRSGIVKDVFIRHLIAQGASREGFESVLESGLNRKRIDVKSDSDGVWLPPDLWDSKDWIKQLRNKYHNASRDPDVEIGFRLLVSPFQEVQKGQTVIELRLPTDMETDLPQWLKGTTASNYSIATKPEVLNS